MCEVKLVETDKLFFFIQQILGRKQRARIRVTGWSMFPFLREYLDSIEFIQPNDIPLGIGDIVLIQRKNHQFVLHRIVRRQIDYFYISGDAQRLIEGPIKSEQLVAVVSAVWRGKKKISCANPWWRILSYTWILLLPYRSTLLRFAKKVKNILDV